MGITRRQFIQLTGASAAGAVAFAACTPPRSELLVESVARLPEDLVTGIDTWYATICRMCPSGCGVIVRVMEGRAKKIEGNPLYPVNQGKLCARGQSGLQALYHPDRIRGPLKRTGPRGSGQFEPISWESALDELLGRLKELQAAGRASESLLITEPLRGHLGYLVFSFNQAFGGQWAPLEPLEDTTLLRTVLSKTFPLYTGWGPLPHFDLANARFVLSFGADFLGSWLSPVQYAVAYGKFRGRPGARGTLVQVEPHLSSTGASADQWVPIKPGSEGALALALAYVMISENLVTPAAARSAGLAPGSPALEAHRPPAVAQATGISEASIQDLARRFATQKPSLAIAGGPAAAHANGPHNLMAVYALNRLVESLGKPGGLLRNPVSPLLAVPEAGFAAPLSYWQELVEAILTGQPRAHALPYGFPGAAPVITPPKVLMVRGANPVHALPPALRFRESLERVPFIASFSSFMDETAALSDLILPEHIYLEDWGSDIPEPAPGFMVLGFQQPVVKPFYDTRSFGDILLTLEGLGLGRLRWKSFRDLLREWVGQLVQLRRVPPQADLEEFWIRLLQQGGWWDEATRETAAPPVEEVRVLELPEPKFSGSEQEYPFHLLPFPSASLGAGEAAHLPWLQATPDPISTAVWMTWVEVNVDTARRLELREGDVVRVESPVSTLEAPVYVHPGIRPDVVAIPLGQGHTALGRYAQGRGANPASLVDPSLQVRGANPFLDPSQQGSDGSLAWAATRVRLIKTEKTVRISKAEGSVTPVEPSDVDIVGVTRE